MGAGCQRAVDPSEEEDEEVDDLPPPPPVLARTPAGSSSWLSVYFKHRACLGCRARCLQPDRDRKELLQVSQPVDADCEDLVELGREKNLVIPTEKTGLLLTRSSATSSGMRSRLENQSLRDPAAEETIWATRPDQARQQVALPTSTPEQTSVQVASSTSPLEQTSLQVARLLQGPPTPVILNIYDVGVSSQMQTLNTCLQGLGTGLFHCGVEVYSVEWSYAASRSGQGSGVFSSPPRECEMQSFRESVVLGETKFSVKGVYQLLQVMEVAWQACDYDLLTHNCCHFCSELGQMLGVGPVPSKVMNLVDASACMVQAWDAFCCKVAAEAGLACNRSKGPAARSQQ